MGPGETVPRVSQQVSGWASGSGSRLCCLLSEGPLFVFCGGPNAETRCSLGGAVAVVYGALYCEGHIARLCSDRQV